MKKLFVANWKSNKTQTEVESWFEDFKPYIGLEQEVIIAPPYPFLSLVADKIKSREDIFVAVQNLSAYPAGSYTGEVCTRNLEGLGVKYAILGHSERRRYFKESSQDVANKVAQALNNQLTPIVCIDQNDINRQANLISSDLLSQCVVAYEPLSAIGTGETAAVEDVAKVVAEIKAVFGQIPVLYGGSINPDNVVPYLAITDGVLVGGASLDSKVFAELLGS